MNREMAKSAKVAKEGEKAEEEKRKHKWQIDMKKILSAIIKMQLRLLWEIREGFSCVFDKRCSNEIGNIAHSEECFEGQLIKS